MKSWTLLSGDVNWADYSGSWARKASDGSWYVLKFDNMLDAVGETEFKSSGLDLYHCEVKRLDLTEISLSTVVKVLRSYDYRLSDVSNVPETCGVAVTLKDGLRHVELSTSRGDVITIDATALCLVECLIGYGLGAPLAEFSGKSYPERVRAAARREAEHLMKDRAAAQVALARKVNRIGSTAAEYGRGDIDAAIARGTGPEAELMRKMSGHRCLGETAAEYVTRLIETGATPPDPAVTLVKKIRGVS